MIAPSLRARARTKGAGRVISTRHFDARGIHSFVPRVAVADDDARDATVERGATRGVEARDSRARRRRARVDRGRRRRRRRTTRARTRFVRELPGAAGGLEEATLAAMRGMSLGDACAEAGATTLTRERRGGEHAIDEDAVARTTERALDAALREKVLVLERHEGRVRATTAREGSVQGAFQRAVFAKKLHERITTRVREEVRRRAESDLRMARRAAQERRLSGRNEAKATMDAKREAPHKPWFLLETPKDEQARLRKAAMVEAANAEAGADAGGRVVVVVDDAGERDDRGRAGYHG